MQTIQGFLQQVKIYANAAGKKTGKAVEVSKLRLKGVQVNALVQSTYERIGALHYEQEKHSADNKAPIAECIKEVDKLLDELSQINRRISECTNGVNCSQCGAVNQAEYTYCSACGAALYRQVTTLSTDDDGFGEEDDER
jgi:hypothetical protein